MQLVYLYIRKYRIWEEQEIPLSSRYQVAYRTANGKEDQREGRQLSIRKTGSPSDILYNKAVRDIHLIVGKNGAGKSTLLRILTEGNEAPERIGNADDNVSTGEEWFAVYLQENSLTADKVSSEESGKDAAGSPVSMVIEGNFFPAISTEPEEACPELTARAYQGFLKDGILCNVERMQNSETPVRYACSLLLFRQPNPIAWYQDSEITPSFPDNTFARACVSTASCQKVLEYIRKIQSHAEKREATQQVATDSMADLFTFVPRNVALAISLDSRSLHPFWQEHIKNTNEEKIWKGDCGNKEAYISRFFYRLLDCIYQLETHSDHPAYVARVLFRNTAAAIDPENLSFCQILQTLLKKQKVAAENIQQLKFHLEQLDESMYTADGLCLGNAVIDCSEEAYGHLSAIIANIEVLNQYLAAAYPEFGAYHSPIAIRFHGLSNGEVQLLHLFSSLYDGISRLYQGNSKADSIKMGRNCVLLLDEPDYGFHPEWSRRLICCLLDTLNQEAFTQFGARFQLIITSHSPILLSDVPKENIACISSREGRKIKTADIGFMSNINDLMKKPFFMDSLFGEASMQTVNEWIREIQKLDREIEADQKKTEPTIPLMAKYHESLQLWENKAQMIGEPVIRNQILYQLQIMRRKCISTVDPEKRKRYQELLAEMRTLEAEMTSQ